ncbi:hypothetical protein T09_13638 [Trichinella sp. T9]|nr:hypothetical protein T09_13638 [Trichinella sp. T9]
MARKLKKVENETQTLTWIMARKQKNVENGTQTL